MIRPLALAVTISVGICAAVGAVAQTPTPAPAQTPTCKNQAAEKKLAGAAKTSFTKKCVSDAAGT